MQCGQRAVHHDPLPRAWNLLLQVQLLLHYLHLLKVKNKTKTHKQLFTLEDYLGACFARARLLDPELLQSLKWKITADRCNFPEMFLIGKIQPF